MFHQNDRLWISEEGRVKRSLAEYTYKSSLNDNILG